MIHININNGFAEITIEAEGRNAVSAEDLMAIADFLEAEGSGLRGLILTGANQSFCSGLMLQKGEDAPCKEQQTAVLFPALEAALEALYNQDCPVVCALTGHAIGAGMLLMCAADRVIALNNPKAKFGLPEVRLDLYITPLMAKVLRKRMTEPQIRKMLFAPAFETLDGICRQGMVDAVCETEEELMDSCRKYLVEMAQHRTSFTYVKQLMRD